MIDQDRFGPCAGSYGPVIWVNPYNGVAKCPQCGRRFERARLAGEAKQCVPLHSPCQLAHIAAEEARKGAK